MNQRKTVVVIVMPGGVQISFVSSESFQEIQLSFYEAMKNDSGIWVIKDADVGNAPDKNDPRTVTKEEKKFIPIKNILFWYGAALETKAIIGIQPITPIHGVQ